MTGAAALTPPPASVLVYSMGEVIGDGLIKLPFLASLRHAFPEARIVWCAAKGETVYQTSLKEVVAGALDEVVVTGVTGAGAADFLLLRRPFDGRRFDLVLDTQTNVRRSLVVRRAAARRFISPAAHFRLSDARPAGPWPLAMVDRLQTLASLGAGRPIPPRRVDLRHPEAEALAKDLLPDDPCYVGFAPGSGGVSKRWPLEGFLALAQAQAARGRAPVFFLGPNETEMEAPIRAAVPGARFPEAEARERGGAVRGPLLVIALAARLAAAAANDAGPGHMFAAGGAPLLSLQGGRRRAAKFHPAAARLEILIAEDYGEADRMEAIPVAAALAALERLVVETPS